MLLNLILATSWWTCGRPVFSWTYLSFHTFSYSDETCQCRSYTFVTSHSVNTACTVGCQWSDECYCRKPIPRNVLAFFHSCGLNDFKDNKGNSLPVSEHASKPSGQESVAVKKEKMVSDSKICEPHQIAIQLLGYER